MPGVLRRPGSEDAHRAEAGSPAGTDVRLRFARGTAAALVATFIALFSHMAGGGTAPPFMGVAVPLFFSLVVCIVLAGCRRSLVRITASVVLSQLVFHWMFTAAASAQAARTLRQAAAGDQAAALGPHAFHAPLPEGFAEAAGAGSAAAVHAGHSGLLMLLAHAGAAVLTIAVLHRAERILACLRDLLRMVGARLRALASDAVPVPVLSPHRGLTGTPLTRVFVPLGVLRSTHLDRGPPAFALAA